MKIHRTSLLLLLILFTFDSCSRKNHSYRINKNSEFKYEYVFSFDYKDDTSRVKIEKREAVKSKISGVVSDKNGIIPPFNIILIGIENHFRKTTEVYWEGKFDYEIPEGKYNMQISNVNAEPFEYKFEVEKNTELNFDIYLKSRQLPTIYQINSKQPLSNNKVKKIKNCIKESRKEPCWKKDKYTISIQI
ncbi:hypothetical protein WAF17_01290 [Bernardetia sp. ABR2-2B]|uniref:hypothetical protein n=1 Tax=Bernardetia sp. ABR2-2B TaxID=3127472 RepID=UPI0030CDEE8F